MPFYREKPVETLDQLTGMQQFEWPFSLRLSSSLEPSIILYDSIAGLYYLMSASVKVPLNSIQEPGKVNRSQRKQRCIEIVVDITKVEIVLETQYNGAVIDFFDFYLIVRSNSTKYLVTKSRRIPLTRRWILLRRSTKRTRSQQQNLQYNLHLRNTIRGFYPIE
jgi:hypothetical protein